MRHLLRAAVLILWALLMAHGIGGAMAQVGSNALPESPVTTGPIRLRQPQTPVYPAENRGAVRDADLERERQLRQLEAPKLEPIYQPSEFERYVQALTNNKQFRRFGAELVIESGDVSATAPPVDFSAVVPGDYVISAGDEIVVSIWGSVDADLRLVVDRSGRIALPRIGSVMVAGVKYQDVAGVIDRQARKVFRNYELSVSLGQLRGVRVFVTGFAIKPGVHTVSNLTSISSVLFNKAGGPTASGSFREIELRRAGKVVARLDLYDLLITGNRQSDQLVQADDVIHVHPVGTQAALIGSVNKPAIFELRPGETLADLLRMGGGLNSVADRTRLAVERLDERSGGRVRQVMLPADAGQVVGAGDVVRAFSAIDAALPLERQNKRVRIEGEVAKPGDYILPPGSSISDALKMAGGTTKAAYLFGTDFSRNTVRLTQQQNYERALRDLEVDVSKRTSSSAARTSEEVVAQTAQQTAADRLVQRLRDLRPTGRVVLQLTPESRELPDLALEDGDRINIPSLPTTVGVFGSVFNAGSYLFNQQRTIDDYLRLAGSPTRGADKDSIFVVRANGSVVSAQQSDAGLLSFGRGGNLLGQPAYPGDTVIVPEELNKTTFVQAAKDWTQILYQFGLGIAGIVAATK
jgi:protein involved in polysaccharide export with SLBB domain